MEYKNVNTHRYISLTRTRTHSAAPEQVSHARVGARWGQLTLRYSLVYIVIILISFSCYYFDFFVYISLLWLLSLALTFFSISFFSDVNTIMVDIDVIGVVSSFLYYHVFISPYTTGSGKLPLEARREAGVSADPAKRSDLVSTRFPWGIWEELDWIANGIACANNH